MPLFHYCIIETDEHDRDCVRHEGVAKISEPNVNGWIEETRNAIKRELKICRKFYIVSLTRISR
jgi:hypothetical protein